MMSMKNKKISIIFTIIFTVIAVVIFVIGTRGLFYTDFHNIAEATVSLISGVDIQKSTVTGNVAVGSGFFYDKGLILTANHNIVNKCFAVTFDGNIYETEVMYSDDINDIAILKIDTNKYPCLKITKGEFKINQDIRCICTPKTIFLKNTMLDGKITNININGLSNQYLLQTDLPLSPGCSGSPVVDKKGHVIGMNAFKSTEFATESLSYAIFGDKLVEAIESFENNKSPIRYDIIFGENFNNQYGLFLESGITVNKIEETSVLNGYFLVNDIIKSIDGKDIFTKADFYENFKFGSTIRLVRDDELKEIIIKE